MSPAFVDHSWVGAEICRLIANFAIDRGLGEVFNSDAGYHLSRYPDTVLSPDASFVSAKRLPPSGEWHGFLPFAPDLAFEVLSPSNTAKEMSGKIRRYLEAGAVMVMIVDPVTKTVNVHMTDSPMLHLSLDDTLDLGAVLPGLVIPVSAIFRRLIDTP